MKVKQIILTVLTVSLVLSGCVSDRGLMADLGLQKSSHAPNIVLILTDDQDLLLDSMECDAAGRRPARQARHDIF